MSPVPSRAVLDKVATRALAELAASTEVDRD